MAKEKTNAVAKKKRYNFEKVKFSRDDLLNPIIKQAKLTKIAMRISFPRPKEHFNLIAYDLC